MKNTLTRIVSFQTGTSGMKKHKEFIDSIDSKGIRIINAYNTYHEYSSSHIPAYLHYVIQETT